MNRSEAATILALCASYDRRTIGEADVAAWIQVIGDLRFQDVSQAIVGHYSRSRDFVMPSEIRTEVRRIRDDRLLRTPLPAPPADLSPLETIAWQRQTTARIADGWEPEPLVLTRPMPSLEGTFRRP